MDAKDTANTHADNLSKEEVQELLAMLSDLYKSLSENDLWYGLWKLNAKFPETKHALALEQTGHWSKAQVAYEKAMAKNRT
eukprot:Pgem_evm1s18685